MLQKESDRTVPPDQQTNPTDMEESKNCDSSQNNLVAEEDMSNTIQIGDRFFKISDDPVVNKELKELKIFVDREKGHG